MKPLKSNGRELCRSTVAPSEPSSTSADELLRTVIELNSSDAKTLKSKPRERLLPPELSVPPVVVSASTPLMRTRVKSRPRPRTVMLRPSPASRSITTPGMRCSDSARLVSGNLAMSSALITSTMPLSSRFLFSALSSEARKPVTSTVLPAAGAGAVCACARLKTPIVSEALPAISKAEAWRMKAGWSSAARAARVSREGRGLRRGSDERWVMRRVSLCSSSRSRGGSPPGSTWRAEGA